MAKVQKPPLLQCNINCLFKYLLLSMETTMQPSMTWLYRPFKAKNIPTSTTKGPSWTFAIYIASHMSFYNSASQSDMTAIVSCSYMMCTLFYMEVFATERERYWHHSQTRPSCHCKFWQSPREIVKKLRFGMKHTMGTALSIVVHIKHKSIYSYFTLHFSHFPLASGLESANDGHKKREIHGNLSCLSKCKGYKDGTQVPT